MAARLFESDRSRIIKLPREYRFQGDEVLVSRIDDVIFLMPKGDRQSGLLNISNLFSDDLTEEGYGETARQERGEL